MQQRLSTLWKQIMTPRPPRAIAEPADEIDALSAAQQQLLSERWWHWRHHYLEAKRLRLQARRDR